MIYSTKRLYLGTAIGALATLLLVVLFYQSFDLPIAKAAHSLKGTFAITLGKLLSNLASKHVIQTISFLALLAGSVERYTQWTSKQITGHAAGSFLDHVRHAYRRRTEMVLWTLPSTNVL